MKHEELYKDVPFLKQEKKVQMTTFKLESSKLWESNIIKFHLQTYLLPNKGKLNTCFSSLNFKDGVV